MLRGSRWLALAAVVAVAALVGPTAALADGCKYGSATSIYSECMPSAKGPAKQHPAPAPTPPPTAPSSTPYVPPPPVHISHKAQHVLKHAGKDASALKNLAMNPGFVDRNRLHTVLASAPTGASLGSAFDLGAGPMILFALLAGSVLALLGTGGVRSWRNRHRV